MFDFYKEFLGVDIAKVEQVAELVGRITAVFYKSMISHGLSDDQARAILRDLETTFMSVAKSD